jgi:hypothetical protein
VVQLVDFDLSWIHKHEVNILFDSDRFSVSQETHLNENEDTVQESNNAYNRSCHPVDAKVVLKPKNTVLLQGVMKLQNVRNLFVIKTFGLT